jgi:hypothetical protein
MGLGNIQAFPVHFPESTVFVFITAKNQRYKREISIQPPLLVKLEVVGQSL